MSDLRLLLHKNKKKLRVGFFLIYGFISMYHILFGLPAPVTVCPFEVFTPLLLLLFQPPTLLVVRFLLFGQEGAVLGLPGIVGFVLDRAGRTGRAVVCRMQLGYGLIAVFCVEGFQVWGWVPLSATERF